MPSESLLNSDSLCCGTYVFAQDRLAPVRSSAPIALACKNPVLGPDVCTTFSPLRQSVREKSDALAQAFAMIRSCTGLPLRTRWNAMTLIVPRSKSISPHFKPNISLCRNPVDAARRTNVRSRSARPSINALISAGTRMAGRCSAFRALTNEVDWVAVKQLISAGMIKEDGHQISDFGTTALC